MKLNMTTIEFLRLSLLTLKIFIGNMFNVTRLTKVPKPAVAQVIADMLESNH